MKKLFKFLSEGCEINSKKEKKKKGTRLSKREVEQILLSLEKGEFPAKSSETNLICASPLGKETRVRSISQSGRGREEWGKGAARQIPPQTKTPMMANKGL